MTCNLKLAMSEHLGKTAIGGDLGILGTQQLLTWPAHPRRGYCGAFNSNVVSEGVPPEGHVTGGGLRLRRARLLSWARSCANASFPQGRAGGVEVARQPQFFPSIQSSLEGATARAACHLCCAPPQCSTGPCLDCCAPVDSQPMAWCALCNQLPWCRSAVCVPPCISSNAPTPLIC